MKGYKKDKESFFKARTYCKCGRFLYKETEDEKFFPKSVSVIVRKKKIVVKCKCGEKTEIKL